MWYFRRGSKRELSVQRGEGSKSSGIKKGEASTRSESNYVEVDETEEQDEGTREEDRVSTTKVRIRKREFRNMQKVTMA